MPKVHVDLAQSVYGTLDYFTFHCDFVSSLLHAKVAPAS